MGKKGVRFAAALFAAIIWTARTASAAECNVSDLERALEANPDSVSARLALARTYQACGRFAEANILFDTVLRLENLPPDMAMQSEIYAEAAERYLEHDEGREGVLVGFDYIEAGIGGYSVTSLPDSGVSKPSELMYIGNLAGALSYLFPSGYALSGSLLYEGAIYDSSTTRNDSDLRARLGVSRAIGEGNIELALRGRMTYIGEGDYRHDYGVSLDWNRALDAENEIALGVFVRRRDYPSGPLEERTRTIADASATWTRALADGAASFSLGIHGGYHYATRRPDGNSGFYGASMRLDWQLIEHLGADFSAFWEDNRFNTDHIHFHPDTLDEAYILRRQDRLYELEAGLTWELAPTWAIRPRVYYVHDNSNLDDFHYGSVEYWVSVRKSFALD